MKTLRLVSAVAALLAAPTALSAEDAGALAELRRSFTVEGLPVPPRVFADFGVGNLAEKPEMGARVDLTAALAARADPPTRKDGWVSFRDGEDEIAYRFIGAARNGRLVAITSFEGGGSGRFVSLHLLDAVETEGRLTLVNRRETPLGDRWNGDVAIQGNAVTVTTTGGVPGDPDRPAKTTIDADAP